MPKVTEVYTKITKMILNIVSDLLCSRNCYFENCYTNCPTCTHYMLQCTVHCNEYGITSIPKICIAISFKSSNKLNLLTKLIGEMPKIVYVSIICWYNCI